MARRGSRWVCRAAKVAFGLFLMSITRTRGWVGAVWKMPFSGEEVALVVLSWLGFMALMRSRRGLM